IVGMVNPTIVHLLRQVVSELKAIIAKDPNTTVRPSKHLLNTNTAEVPKSNMYNSFHGELSRLYKNLVQ
ncbi:unnamed protein product, partial [Rhizophagus irregularis]